MSKPVVEPVSGPDLCPECEGKRVIPWNTLMNQTPSRDKRFSFYQSYNVLLDEDGHCFVWCGLCGGSGTATDAMERVMLGANTPAAGKRDL